MLRQFYRRLLFLCCEMKDSNVALNPFSSSIRFNFSVFRLKVGGDSLLKKNMLCSASRLLQVRGSGLDIIGCCFVFSTLLHFISVTSCALPSWCLPLSRHHWSLQWNLLPFRAAAVIDYPSAAARLIYSYHQRYTVSACFRSLNPWTHQIARAKNKGTVDFGVAQSVIKNT